MNLKTWLKLVTLLLLGYWLAALMQLSFEKGILSNLFFDVQLVLLVILTNLLLLYKEVEK